jgi:hypothetical protein
MLTVLTQPYIAYATAYYALLCLCRCSAPPVAPPPPRAPLRPYMCDKRAASRTRRHLFKFLLTTLSLFKSGQQGRVPHQAALGLFSSHIPAYDQSVPLHCLGDLPVGLVLGYSAATLLVELAHFKVTASCASEA